MWNTPSRLEPEEVQFVCLGVTCVQQPWKNFAALTAIDKEAPNERINISADLRDIKIIKKEGRLKGKWL